MNALERLHGRTGGGGGGINREGAGNPQQLLAAAMRAREAMGHERDAALESEAKAVAQYEELQASTTNDIKVLQHKVRFLQERLHDSLEIQEQVAGDDVESLRDTSATLLNQLRASRQAFQRVSTHARGVERTNFKLVSEMAKLTKQFGLEQGQHERTAARLEQRLQRANHARLEHEDSKNALVKLSQQQQQQVGQLTKELKVVQGQRGNQPLQIQALRADQEQLAAYALSMEAHLSQFGRIKERLGTAERTLTISRKHRQKVETALRLLFARHQHMMMRQEELQAELEQTIVERDQLRQELAQARQNIAQLEQLVAQQQAKIVELEQALARMHAELVQTQQTLAEERAHFAAEKEQLQSRVRTLEAELEEMRRSHAAEMRRKDMEHEQATRQAQAQFLGELDELRRKDQLELQRSKSHYEEEIQHIHEVDDEAIERLQRKLEHAKKTGNVEHVKWKEWKRKHRQKEDHLIEEKTQRLNGLLRETAQKVMSVETDVQRALSVLKNQEETMQKEIEEHGWEKVQRSLQDSGGTAFDKTGHLLTASELAENQLKQAQKVLGQMRAAKKVARKKNAAKRAADKLKAELAEQRARKKEEQERGEETDDDDDEEEEEEEGE